jgi:hypothetical protein
MNCAVSKYSEGDGFFCIHVETELVGTMHAQAGQKFAEARHQQVIMRSAAGNDEAVNGGLTQYETFQCVNDCACGQFSGGAKQILGPCAMDIADCRWSIVDLSNRRRASPSGSG